MTDDRLSRQLDFVVELDKLKQVLRQTTLVDESRRENSAEHSWHLAVMAIVLAEYSDQPVDIKRVLQMVLLHDVVEVDAGDTFCYDAEAVVDQKEREELAATRIFGLLPTDQSRALASVWHEFEARETPEARFAAALDRLQPLLQNLRSGGGTWTKHGITRSQVTARMAPVGETSRSLGAYVRAMLADAVSQGFIRDD